MSVVAIAPSLRALIAGALLQAVPCAYGVSGSKQIAWPGRPMSAKTGWPPGVLQLINDPLRTGGWTVFYPFGFNDVDYFVLRVRDTDDANRLIQTYADIKADNAQIRLNPGKQPVIQFTRM